MGKKETELRLSGLLHVCPSCSFYLLINLSIKFWFRRYFDIKSEAWRFIRNAKRVWIDSQILMLCVAYSKSFQMCAIMQISHYFDIILAKNNEMMAKKPRTKSKNMSILPRIAVSYRIQIGLLFWIIAVFVLNGVSCYGLISIGIQYEIF